MKEVVHSLPPANFAVAKRVIELCVKVASNSPINKMNPSNLGALLLLFPCSGLFPDAFHCLCMMTAGALLGPNLAYPAVSEDADLLRDMSIANLLVEFLIQHYDKLFGTDGAHTDASSLATASLNHAEANAVSSSEERTRKSPKGSSELASSADAESLSDDTSEGDEADGYKSRHSSGDALSVPRASLGSSKDKDDSSWATGSGNEVEVDRSVVGMASSSGDSIPTAASVKQTRHKANSLDEDDLPQPVAHRRYLPFIGGSGGGGGGAGSGPSGNVWDDDLRRTDGGKKRDKANKRKEKKEKKHKEKKEEKKTFMFKASLKLDKLSSPIKQATERSTVAALPKIERLPLPMDKLLSPMDKPLSPQRAAHNQQSSGEKGASPRPARNDSTNPSPRRSSADEASPRYLQQHDLSPSPGSAPSSSPIEEAGQEGGRKGLMEAEMDIALTAFEGAGGGAGNVSFSGVKEAEDLHTSTPRVIHRTLSGGISGGACA